MPKVLIGRRNYFVGKTLWEILGNLKNFGVGRIVYRNVFQRYSEPCYYKIMKVAALPELEPYEEKGLSYTEERKVIALVEKTFRGKTHDHLVQLDKTTYKSDYRLVPKDEEEEFCRIKEAKLKEIILPAYAEYPPLFKKILMRNMRLAGETVNEDPKLEMCYNMTGFKPNVRVARDGETPNVEVTPMGKKLSPHLYQS